ncbi:MAG: hypothetical protein P4L66_09010 [Acetobacteraceae bacterium]|nr:hypothetical protein [Acetobacteraceae bacterium]
MSQGDGRKLANDSKICLMRLRARLFRKSALDETTVSNTDSPKQQLFDGILGGLILCFISFAGIFIMYEYWHR